MGRVKKSALFFCSEFSNADHAVCLFAVGMEAARNRYMTEPSLIWRKEKGSLSASFCKYF
ncbi:hypothetical protein B4110_2456 [Parageobacillus toebii]|uniref:Uncharacterized protein n=1 Tax=Parageobacillus toebii TaxID=153151 RepID=A0A150MSQ8_9BACL|nr:hypothetical protein B4110_2456 [Parageobacillus toebii]